MNLPLTLKNECESGQFYEKNKQNIIYDRESRVLSIELKQGKSVDSEIQGNAVIDYDKSGKAMRISLYDFDFNDFKSSSRALQRFSKHARIPFRVLARK